MKTISPALQQALEAEAATICRVWEIERADGQILRFTDLDIDIEYQDELYRSQTGFTTSAIFNAANTTQQDVQLGIILGATAITDLDIYNGQFDNAKCSLKLIDYKNPLSGDMILFNGIVKDILLDNQGSASMTLRGFIDTHRTLLHEVYSATCRADLGDARCQVDIEAIAHNFTVTNVIDHFRFETDLTEEDNEFDLGTIIWQEGNNSVISPRSVEVRQSAEENGLVVLMIPMPFAIEVGDEGRIYPGCNKTFTMCRDRYDNLINMRGEPYMSDFIEDVSG